MSIRAEGQLTFSDLWSGSLFHSRRTVILFSALGVAMLLLAAFVAFHGLNRPGARRDELTMIAVGIFWIAYGPLGILYRSNLNLRKNPALQGPGRYVFGQDGYVREGPHSRAEIKWSALVRWKESKNSFLLYPNPRAFITVPKRFFQNSGDVDALRSLLQANVRGE